MTLREVCTEIIGIDDEPMSCAFMIAAVLRTCGQGGSPSTFEGECASLVKAVELLGINLTDPEDIRWWLDDIKAVSDFDMPRDFWERMVAAAEADESNEC